MSDLTAEEAAARFAMVLFRYLLDLDQAGFSRETGVAPSRISDFDRGKRPIRRETLETFAAAAGFPIPLLDLLLFFLRSFRVTARGRSRIDRALADGTGAELLLLLREAADLVLQPLDANRAPRLEDRAQADSLWDRLERRTPEDRLVLVEEGREFQSWALCERVAAESVTRAANHPREALGLAELALAIAHRVPGGAAWRWRLVGYCRGHVSNAWRALEDLPAAEAELIRAWTLWKAGASGDPGLLNGAWLPWFEANLRRGQRRFKEALVKIEEALALDRTDLRGKILISKANIFKVLGDPESSAAFLSLAAPLIDEDREPRLALVLRFNLLEDLCQLGRAAEVAARLPQVQALAERLGERLDLVRVAWLSGRTAAALGRPAEALATFAEVRAEFEERGLTYDYALVSFDLSLVLLEEGRTAEVRQVAEEMLRIFDAQEVHREALAALHVFCEAARREAATVELTRRVERYLRRARLDPGLRFEEE
jgi:tetratricopeptide (TPR) repeat protein